MRKNLSITIALLATSMAWAQPQSAPGDPEYISDKDIICSYSNTTSWHGKANSYTYPETGITLNYMHFSVIQGNGDARQWGVANDFSANEKEYVHLEIYPMADVNLTLDLIAGGTETVTASLTANQWNSLDYDLAAFGVTDLSNVGTVRFRCFESDADFYVDNYYFHHGIRPSGPMSSPGALLYNSDQDVICSASGVCLKFEGFSSATVESYTYPGTSTVMPYMHIKMPQNGYSRETTTFDFSANGTEYIHFEIWTQKNTTLSLKLSAKSNGTDLTVNLTGGQWNSFDYDLATDLGATSLNGVGSVRFKALDAGGADIYIDNYYFHHKQAPSTPKLEVGTPNAEGIAAVTGPVTVATVNDFLTEIQKDQYKNIVLYDLTGADYTSFPASNAFTTRWTAANPNAVFAIKWVAASYSNRFVDKTNVGFVSLTNKKFYRFGNVEFTDGYDILYPGYQIGTMDNTPAESTISYNRASITGVATTILPFSAAVPTGVTAYEFSTFDTSQNKLVFTSVTTMEAFKPYIIVGSSMQVSTSENVTAMQPASVDIAGVATFTGTFQAISAATTTAVGNMYVLSSDVFKKSNGKIGAFRAYMTFNAAPSRNFSVVFDDETTGLRPATLEEMETLFNVYSIDGRVVKTKTDTMIDLPEGIYVINGKKVIIK